MSIQRWSDAFLIYLSIYVAVHPLRREHLIKYMHNIRLGTQQSNGWAIYDEQFRFRMAHNPFQDWGIVDNELWLSYMTPSLYKPVNNPQPKCFDNNFKGNCFKSHIVNGALNATIPIHPCHELMLTRHRVNQTNPFEHLSQSASVFTPHSDLRFQFTKHAQSSHWPEMLANAQDIRDLGQSPIINSAIIKYLSKYRDRVSACILQDGFKHRFRLQYSEPCTQVFSKYFSSASDHEDVLLEKIHNEVKAGCMSGPY